MQGVGFLHFLLVAPVWLLQTGLLCPAVGLSRQLALLQYSVECGLEPLPWVHGDEYVLSDPSQKVR